MRCSTDVAFVAATAAVLLVSSAVQLVLLQQSPDLTADLPSWRAAPGEVLRLSAQVEALAHLANRSREVTADCLAAVRREGRLFKEQLEAETARLSSSRKSPRGRAPRPALGGGDVDAAVRATDGLRAGLRQKKQSLDYATNTVDKLRYELRNMGSARGPRTVPQFNPIPLADRPAGQAVHNLVIGVSSVNRRKNYLLDTLRNLLGHMSEKEKRENIIVVLNGDVPPSKHEDVPKARAEFAAELDSGLLRIIEHPDPERGHEQLAPERELTLRWGDSLERVRWRAKQVLDVALLMDSCARHTEYDYFLMLEDDVHSAVGFPTAIREWVDSSLSWRTDWTVASFYNPWPMRDLEDVPVYKFFGVIGQLFRVTDLGWVVQFLRHNFDESPLDWLFVDLLTKTGGRIVAHSPSLFQHMGVVSSLKNKIQPSRAVDFDENPLRRRR
eukprot:TRINITY_DN12963_c0_g1_i1.p1 TRINITY_DN12963_c0_g1~~TRINITY_DN12963_c0_g1_i1.p1  ORF type:complete len:442 (+),score=160.33 TRINITY_DN12963_c0_g1_i1:81-1406(+)